MQIRVLKNAAYFATSPAYFGCVRVAFFLLFGRFFPGGLISNINYSNNINYHNNDHNYSEMANYKYAITVDLIRVTACMYIQVAFAENQFSCSVRI